MPLAYVRRQQPIVWRMRRALGVAGALGAGLAMAACSLDSEGTGTSAVAAPPPTAPGVVLDGEVGAEVAVQQTLDAGSAHAVDAAAGAPAADDASGPSEPERGGPSPVGPGDRDRDSALGDRPNTCRANGAYALRVDFDVSWLGTSLAGVIPVIAPGSGTLTVFASALVSREQNDSEAQIRACGAAIPDFMAGDNAFYSERYGVYIPDESWDRPTMPVWTIFWQRDCAAPGCGFRASELDAQLGGRRSSGAREFSAAIDDDGDGRPGMTLLTRGPPEVSADGQPYVEPPLGWQLWARAQKIMLAIGVRVGLEGAFEDCDRIAGRTPVGAVETSALACSGTTELGPGEIECDAAAVQFLGENLPVWTVRGGRFIAQRIREPSCAAVRAALAR